MGIVQSRVWKIRNGKLLPNEDDLKAWAEATGHPEAAGELAEMLAGGPRRAGVQHGIPPQGRCRRLSRTGSGPSRSSRSRG